MTPPSASSSSSATAPQANNFRHIYEVTGDSSAALKCLKGQTSAEAEYNRHILKACITTTTNSTGKDNNNNNNASSSSWLNDLSTVETPFVASPKKRRDDWIVTYNRGLVLLTMGRPQACLDIVLVKLNPIMASNNNNTNKLSKELTSIACRMAFLVLEALLALSVPLPKNTTTTTTTNNNSVVVDRDAIVSWLTTAAVEGMMDNDPTLKFQFSLYKGRLDFLDRKDSKLVDAKIRSCRKELKVAMEIFQHKLRPSSGGGGGLGGGGGTTNASDTLSLASSSALSAETDTQPSSSHHHHHHNHQAHSGGNNNNNNNNNNNSGGGGGNSGGDLGSVLLGQNRAALNLKANTEQLKGNVKKSLILLAEAANDDNTTTGGAASDNNNTYKSSYQSLHYNNLGVVYNTSGKRHLALHAWSKALNACNNNNNNVSSSLERQFESDGVARIDVRLRIYYNAAIGALQAQNFEAAYQCMANCLTEWNTEPRCWLRLSEACVGIIAKMKKENGGLQFSKIEGNGEPCGILLNASKPYTGACSGFEHPLGSDEDLKQVQENPLPRAHMALKKAISLFEQNKNNSDDSCYDDEDTMGISQAHLSLSFVCLEQSDYKPALTHAQWVLDNVSVSKTADAVRSAWVKRQLATARMYASEASCALGETVSSMRHLVGDGKDDAFDRLASELAGVTIGTAAAVPEGKSRLAKAQAMVRCSASVASAELGNLPAAKQLAMSAQAMEDSYLPSRENSLARRALMYCNLREGNTGGSFTLMRSAR